MNIDGFKTHFYSGDQFVHLNNAGQSLIPDVNRELAIQWIHRFYTEGSLCAMECWEQTDVVRQKLAKFIGAKPQEVSFFQTTSSAISQAAFKIPLTAGDEVLVWDQEYPSNFYPWLKATKENNAKLIQVESDNWKTPAQKILERVNKNTRVIAVSWVQYQTGAVTDLKMISEALKDRDIWLVADVVQGVGLRPFNFHETGFDIICGGSHKWLCSSYGASYMAIKESCMDELEPLAVGAMTYGTPDTEKKITNLPKADASRYEPGTKSMIEVVAMGASIDLLQNVGVDKIYIESCRLADKLGRGLVERQFKVIDEGPFINFAPSEKMIKNQNLDQIIQKLIDAKVSFAKRGPGIRLSVHGYNRDSEIDKVLRIFE